MKAGLTHNIDLQLVLQTFAWNEETASGSTQRKRGLGAISVRTKINMWGNDAGRTAFALMPFVAFVSDPGESRRIVNFGLVMPFRVDLGSGWGLATMAEFDLAAESGGFSTEGRHDRLGLDRPRHRGATLVLRGGLRWDHPGG